MITVENVTHRYQVRWRPGPGTPALENLSCAIEPGSVVGLIGMNGAGKTTLLRILLGYLDPNDGTARIEGMRPREYVQHHGIAYVPERVAIPRRWTVEGALQAYAMLGNLDHAVEERIAWTLQRLGLSEVRRRRVGRLSKGTLQRLAIAQAILCERRVMVLDEPTEGLDPVWTNELREIIRGWRSEGEATRTALIASHDLGLIERLADRVIVLHQGRILEDLTDFQRTHVENGSLEAAFLQLMRAQVTAA